MKKERKKFAEVAPRIIYFVREYWTDEDFVEQAVAIINEMKKEVGEEDWAKGVALTLERFYDVGMGDGVSSMLP